MRVGANFCQIRQIFLPPKFLPLRYQAKLGLTSLFCFSRDPPMLQPTDTTCYKQPKAKIGRSRVRPWAWMEFSNPARSDGLKLCHWRRKADEGKEYPFAQFGKSRHDVVYTEEEFNVRLQFFFL